MVTCDVRVSWKKNEEDIIGIGWNLYIMFHMMKDRLCMYTQHRWKIIYVYKINGTFDADAVREPALTLYFV